MDRSRSSPLISLAFMAVLFASAGDAAGAESGDVTPAHLTPGIDAALPDRGFEFIRLAPLPFERDQAALSERDKRMLDEMAVFIRLVPGITRVLVKGHSDRDTADADGELSLRHAAEVRDYLIARGVSEKLIRATGYGSALPVDEDWTAEGRARNRRIEIYAVRRR